MLQPPTNYFWHFGHKRYTLYPENYVEIGSHDSVEQYTSFEGDKRPQDVKNDVLSGKCYISIFFLI